MIYINKVVTNAPMKVVETERDFLFFKNCEPQKLKYPTSEAMEKEIKQKQMDIVIAGTMVGDLRRNNKNVFSRSLLFVDFDNINETEEDFLSKLKESLNGVNYCLYPTLKYKPKENIRYRLVLELDREVNAKEYEILLFGLSKELGVDFKLDESNKTWSQGQGLPVVTEYSKNVGRAFHDGYNAVPVDKFLLNITSSKPYKEALKTKHRGFNGNQGFTRSSGEQKYTGQLLELLFNGAVHGERHPWWLKMIDKLLAVDTPVETIAKIIEVINFNPAIFPEPLEIEELENMYLARIKNHVENGGRLF